MFPTRRLYVVLLPALALGVAVACNDDDDAGSIDASPAATGTASGSTPGVTVPPRSTPDASSEEVVGIVGAVNEAENSIEITQLSGAEVTAIDVSGSTRITTASGTALTLSDLRASDRIIASGEVEGSTMAADRIEVQPAVPGASPGG